jgi:ornithine carbamoyltransferase
MVRHFLEITDFTLQELEKVLRLARRIKAHPEVYSGAMTDLTLLMLFEQPSLRTRISFEVGMTQMGGHAIFYSIAHSSIGKKESMADSARAASRMVDLIMARLLRHANLEELARYSSVPVINALTERGHPCQIVADLMTIEEKIGPPRGLKLAYLGDGNNNVTHSLLYGAALTGMDISVACPRGEEYEPQKRIVRRARELAKESGSKVEVLHDAGEAVRGADIVYTDSWMSYHIPPSQEAVRVKVFEPYRVTAEIMALAKKDAVFMNCLPAKRGYEQTAEVIDGPQSIVFDQAENRLHSQKAIMLHLTGRI